MLFPQRLRSLTRSGLITLFVWLGSSLASALNPNTPAEGFAIQGWFSEDGLPSSRVRSVLEARDGYLWLATAQGIARFDGNRFTVFSAANTAELRSSNFYEIEQTPDGDLWFASAIGLYRLHEGRFTFFGPAQGLPSENIRTMRLIKDGTMLVGTDHGVALVRGGRVVPLEDPWKAITSGIRAFTQRRDGSVIVSARDSLWLVAGGRAEKLSGTERFPDAAYTASVEDGQGRLWVACNRDLRCWYPDGHVDVFGAAQGLTSHAVETLFVDRDGPVWVGTAGGLFRVRDGQVERATYASQIGASLMGQMCETREGALWVSSNTGVFQLRDTPARAVSYEQGLDQAVVMTMIDRQDGSWWIGLWNGGIYRYADGRASRVAEFAAKPGTIYYALWEDPDRTMWVGSDAGLYRQRPGGKWENLYLGRTASEAWLKKLAQDPDLELPGLAHSRTNCVSPDGAGGHWISTPGGVYHRSADDKFRIEPKTAGIHVRGVYRLPNGDVWATLMNHGAMRLHDGAWTTYTVADGLASDAPRAVYQDSVGDIWLGSTGGLTRFRNGHFRAYLPRDGLVDNVISIIEDTGGYFWLGTPKGLMRVERSQFDEFDAGRTDRIRGETITRRDGMPDSECIELGWPNAWMTRTGLLLFPTNSGLAVIDPRAVKFNPVPPPVQIEGVTVAGEARPLNAVQSFPPGSRDVEIQFSAASLLVPERVRFKVKLAPLDTDWVNIGARRDIRYPRLPPGRYDFHVIASNNDGVWNEEGAHLAFTVRPFFYQTEWFFALGLVSLSGAAFGGFRWWMRRLRARAAELQAQNVELERRVAERTAALAQRSAELAKSYETLRASEYLYHSLVESLPQIIVRKDAEGVITYANSAFAELHQRRLDEIVGRTESELLPSEQAERTRQEDQRVMSTRSPIESESIVERDGRKRFLHVKKVPLHNAQNQSIGVQVLYWDVTVFRETEEQLRQAQKDLIESSRLAGMAEVATGVLHNIGNVLNSVNTSASLISGGVRQLRIPSLAKVAQLMVENGERLGEFFATDARAQKLPLFLTQLAEHLGHERDAVLQEVRNLLTNVEHIKDIVAAQQSFARVAGVAEVLPPEQLLELALGISDVSFTRHTITVVRHFEPVPPISVERPKALQILVNLLRNAKDAIVDADNGARTVTLSLRLEGEGMVAMTVADTGVGIAPENLSRVFGFGFTTKKNGHGFGLHASALTARELGGSLTGHSDGLGRGATFTLRLPLSPPSAVPGGTSKE